MSDSIRSFEDGLARISAEFEGAFAASADEGALRAANARFAGPSGDLTALLKLMPSLPGDRRKELGQRANQVKSAISAAFEARLGGIVRAAREADLAGPPIDVSLPGRATRPGRPHPITATIEELLDGFASLGFEIAESREIELTDFNFARLGFPPDHPATDMQDSFWTTGSLLLRTHTSNVQIRAMTTHAPPMAFIAPGTTYRRDDDATHSPMFHQIEGLWVEEGVSRGACIGGRRAPASSRACP